MDYSGCRKTHRFPPPYGLGSHSLTQRPTENPTGMTKKQPLPTLALPEQGRESSNTPSPDWGRSGWGVSRKGFVFIVILNSGVERNVIQNPLQVSPMRHTGLDPVSPSSSEGFKIIQSFAICPIMRFRSTFGLFGLSENSSFSSTLRAWFAFAHSSPYRKSNRNDKRNDRSPP